MGVQANLVLYDSFSNAHENQYELSGSQQVGLSIP